MNRGSSITSDRLTIDFHAIDCTAEVVLHRRLSHHLRARLAPSFADDSDLAQGDDEIADALALRGFLRRERELAAEQCVDVPSDPAGFITWFQALHEHGPGQGDPLFPWLAAEADEAAMLWFLRQELAGEAGFDDLVAMALVRMPARPKMEMARNLWDEFGRGNPSGVHGTLLARMAHELDISCTIEEAVPETLAQANVMAGLSVERWSYHAIGALGVIELTAPDRVACIAAGMRRLGMPAAALRYYDLHAILDVEHARRWNAEVLQPLVAADPRTAPLIAQGAIMRLEAGRRCFSRYRSFFFGS